ncbi:hypothetical protein PR202_gb23831 [Eleusine coracana subsp. coracana]|uniref:NB-ARC domain-containing protein n=1 Tax=Eleusine coracana subsp. coracana TaxID=191504 RepID=A0AAV5FH87_ELECO|nr:hypothetical protein PR202_gb23831 [Eleusine coracana subsp. coracana]
MRVAASAVGADGEIVDRVLENLQGLSGDLVEFIMLLQGYRPIRQPLATNIFMEGQMFGRHVEKERIINFLLHDGGGKSMGQLAVLPIVGDIGVGKTTLVQHACDDPRVRNHFFLIMLFNFTCTYAIATSEATVVLWSKHVIGDPGVNIKEPLQLIKRDFGNKRFLMVLPQPQYWFFFKAHAFRGRDVEENPRLVAAGKAIVRKLNGSFFGAKIVRGLLKDHPDPKFWCKVLRSNIGGLSLLGDGLAYIADLVENLLPKNVDMCHVTISKDQYSQTELARFQDLCDS